MLVLATTYFLTFHGFRGNGCGIIRELLAFGVVVGCLNMWPCGLMDKALVFGTKDCRLESCQGHACAFVGPAACPRHAARCHLGPRQRAGARRGRGMSRPGDTLAGHPRQARGSSGPPQARPDQGPGGAFRARRSRSHKTAAAWIARFYEEITHERRPSSEGGGSCPER